MRIGVVGLRWDGTARVVRTLVQAGHDVLAVHEGSMDGSTIPEERLLELDSVESEYALLRDGIGFHDALESEGWAAVARDLVECEAVVLGRWHGWLEWGVGRQALEWARRVGVTLIAMESRNVVIDTTVTAFSQWAAELKAKQHLRIIRDNDPGTPTRSLATVRGGDLPQVLVRSHPRVSSRRRRRWRQSVPNGCGRSGTCRLPVCHGRRTDGSAEVSNTSGWPRLVRAFARIIPTGSTGIRPTAFRRWSCEAWVKGGRRPLYGWSVTRMPSPMTGLERRGPC